MAVVELPQHIAALHGQVGVKFNKRQRSFTYFAQRYDVTHLNRYSRNETYDFSPAQLASQARFKAAHEQAIEAIMDASTRPGLEAEFKSSGGKYNTLLGYVFAKILKEL